MPRLRRLILVLIPLVALVVAGACFLLPGHNKDNPQKEVPAGAATVAIPKRLYGEPQICAVSGQPFNLASESRSAVYQGRTYYFSNEAALKAFLAEPEGYVPDPIPPAPSR